jgi:hypothetical protein
MCKTQILTHHRLPINEFVDASIRRLLPAELALRRQELEEELREMGGRPRQDGGVTIPGEAAGRAWPKLKKQLFTSHPSQCSSAQSVSPTSRVRCTCLSPSTG